MPGHIQKRAGKYVLRLHAGRHKWISRSFATEGDAREAQTRLSSHTLTRAAQLGLYGDPRGRFGAYLVSWAEDRQGYAPATLERIESVVGQVRVDPIAAIRYANLTPKILADYYRRLAQTRARGTVTRHHAVIRKALQDAVDEEILLANPAKKIRLKDIFNGPRQRPVIEPPTESQVILLLSSDSRFRPVYEFAASTVTRQGEILGLAWPHVHLEKAAVDIAQSLYRPKRGGYLLKSPKTESSRRAHPLTPATVAMLGAVKAQQESEKARRALCPQGVECRNKYCRAWHETGLVFTLANGKPLHKRNLVRDLHETCRALGLPQVRFHDFRHFAATYLMANGVPARDVMELGGWSPGSTAFFLATYVHGTDQGQERAVAAFARLLSIPSFSRHSG